MTISRILLVSALLLAACNAPPLYRTRARAFLAEQGISEDLIERLVRVQPINRDEAERLSQFDDIAVLHLLGSNPSISEELIRRLAKHSNFEVRTGLAANPSTPLPLLLSFRKPGQYTTVNDYLARNPRLPEDILREMYDNGEVSKVSLGLNPNCPMDLMAEIAQDKSELARAWLATNENLPPELMQQLAQDESAIVRKHLATNPSYKQRHQDSAATY